MSKPQEVVTFEMCGYQFRFGPSQRDGDRPFSPLEDTLCLWRWNGYYWQVEIADCTDLEGAKHSMQYQLAFEKQDRERAERKATQATGNSGGEK